MPVASGNCPSCGAPIEFSVGSSVSKVCKFCNATVLRTDRGLENIGKVAAIANTPSLIAIDDEGTLGGRPFRVAGRVQLDHGAGPWDEYYVSLDNGAAWAWLAYAEGVWYATSLSEPTSVKPFESMRIEDDISLGRAGTFRVAEVKHGRVVSAEGELPARIPPGFDRSYVDLFGAGAGFATVDYGDRKGPPEIFVGRRFEEHELRVTARGPRTAEKIAVNMIRCPNCGGDLPKLSGERVERIGCGYCGAVSDIAERKVIAAQDRAALSSPIPLGTVGLLNNIRYCAIAAVTRSTNTDGEYFAWVEVLLFAEGVGFRWLVRDETTWLFVEPVNLAEVDLRAMPNALGYRGRSYRMRNSGVARVDSVFGEVYWKCAIGETVQASDYTMGATVVSREQSPGEVRYSRSVPIPWSVIARAFGLPANQPGAAVVAPAATTAQVGSSAGVIAFIVILLVVVAISNANSCSGGGGGAVFGGSGYYYGGK